MVEISLSGSGEGPGSVTAPGYSTAGFPAPLGETIFVHLPLGWPIGRTLFVLTSEDFEPEKTAARSAKIETTPRQERPHPFSRRGESIRVGRPASPGAGSCLCHGQLARVFSTGTRAIEPTERRSSAASLSGMTTTKQQRIVRELRHLPQRQEGRSSWLARARESVATHGAEAVEVDRPVEGINRFRSALFHVGWPCGR